MYVPKNGAPAYISQKPKEDKNRQFNNDRDFTIPLSVVGKRTRQKVNKERKDFNNTINKLELTGKKK